ncbi:TIGR04283 family arsenosugar biosynthesis glycosyltransferase [Spirosoma montaniterrae]|uniref:Glycosyl transferase n=1 Tax=Spirosoma montaniterrae TaxID=1178516 RepID=A0A1P9X049_9BACT|nr:TIGR04283 family arsenosugar biosynthesis glycosyltransferase [Spirosoma montaniterrae]AQG80992.1 glycosyl transferase [Spirosoma montaniterrae]
MKLSIIIPTQNESGHIGQVVRDLRQHGGNRLTDILVIDANSTDNTADEARCAGATVVVTNQTGRAAQMNLGAKHATGNVLYFVHADVGINPDFVADIEQALQAGYEAGCYRFRFDSAHPMLRVNSYGTRFSGLMSRGGDQTLFITRSLFDRLNGFDEHYVIMEDFDIIRRIRQVTRFAIIPKDVLVSARKYETNSWLRVQLANLTAFLLFFLRVAPTRIARTYKAMLNYR